MENSDQIVECPHCKQFIIIEKINCGVFRHGTYIYNGEQINPHLSKKICDDLVDKKVIFGCGKPFKITIIENNKYNIEICDYI